MRHLRAIRALWPAGGGGGGLAACVDLRDDRWRAAPRARRGDRRRLSAQPDQPRQRDAGSRQDRLGEAHADLHGAVRRGDLRRGVGAARGGARRAAELTDTVARCLRRGVQPGRRQAAMIIDCHGHYTTSPRQHEGWRTQQIEAHAAGKAPPPRPAISDDEIRETITGGQLKVQRERGTDLTIFAPRAAGMGHHLGDASTSEAWSSACNELIHRVCLLFPKNFIGVAMLPQSARVSPKNCIPEIDRCVNEYGFVGLNLNPDPSGGHWQDPPLGDRYWYPVYEKMVEHDIPAMIHVSASCNPTHHTTGAHYLNGDTAGFNQLMTSSVLKDFPTIKFIIPHGGGAVP